MSLLEAKDIYTTLLRNGELKMMLPTATGKWSVDKNKFIRIYESNEELINTEIIIDLDTDEDY